MLEDCQKYGRTPVSIANDWKTIYGDGVTYTGAKQELVQAA